jgi:hypothetical protein
MGDPRSAAGHRTVWSLLRRTRQRFQSIAREQPLFADRLGRVVESLATEEAALIAEDPELAFRQGRVPRGGAGAGGAGGGCSRGLV